MYLRTSQIVERADELIRRCGTRDPRAMASELGVEILPRDFVSQKGAYKIVMRNPFIFIKSDLDPVMENIVLCHELGHHCLHRQEAESLGGFREFNLFDMRQGRLEYEANIFASQLSLPDEEVLRCIDLGYDIRATAAALMSDINLVALKIDTLISRGYRLVRQDHQSEFLRDSGK